MEIFYSYAIFCEKTKYYTFYKKKLKTFLDEKEKIAFQNNEILSEE